MSASLGVIDHLVLAAPAVDAAVDALERRLGVRATAGGRHEGIGTHNALLSLGPRTYLEIIGPDPSQPTPSNPRPFGVDDVVAPKLVGWAVACDDIDAAVARSRELGYDPGDPLDMTRTTPDGSVLRWRLTLNAIAGGPVPFLISWGETPHPASTSPGGAVLESFVVEHPDPAGLLPVLQALGVDVEVRAGPVALVAGIRSSQGVEELR